MLKNENAIFEISSDASFEKCCLEIFALQYRNNPVYRRWAELLKTAPGIVTRSTEIPFLPIEFFKNLQVITGDVTESTLSFTSSATTSSLPSRHFVKDPALYEKS